MRNLDQIRADRAFSQVTSADEPAASLPHMLQRNGLLATMAFFLHKYKGEAGFPLQLLLDHLSDPAVGTGIGLDNRQVVDVFREWVGPNGLDGPQLRRLTAEAIEFSGWVKRAYQATAGADARE